ncbi:hypothetical protein REPUB_Repub18cG0043500 [Reevesia pubescens]
MVGDVEEMEICGDRITLGRALRMGVLINVHKPLRRCSMLSLPNGEKIMVTFKYEHLLDLCYICRCMDHLESDCSTVVAMRKDHGGVKREYGCWLRAEVRNIWGVHTEFTRSDS